MSTTIKPAASPIKPVIPPAPSPPAAQRGNSSPSRRNETDRLRETTTERTRRFDDAAVLSDGAFFQGLLMESSSTDDFSGAAPTSSLQPWPPAAFGQMVEEVARLTPEGDQPLEAIVLMPHLGKINIKASRNETPWNIRLGLDRIDALGRLQEHHAECEEGLKRALGRDVVLSLHHEPYL